MIEIVLARDDVDFIRGELTDGETEKCAILYATQTRRTDGTVRLLVREVQVAEPSDYTRKGELEAELKPELVARVTKRARVEGYALVFAHSHPGNEMPEFSRVDLLGERHLAKFFKRRKSELAHAALVVSAGGMKARRIGTNEYCRIISIGPDREVLSDPTPTGPPIAAAFDRQVRAFGTAGQQALQRLRVAIVGLGGTGSIVAQELVHLGVRDFVLIDPDVLDETNLNRVANATPEHIGRPKTEIVARYIESLSQRASIECIEGDVIRARVAKRLTDADLIFGCTDSHGSRAVLQQVAYQYLIPLIDMGVTISVTKGSVSHIYGRIQLLAPSLACFTCGELLDPNQVRQDMMTAFERQADPYIQGIQEPAPAVMSLNGTVASLAVTMFLSVVAGVPVSARHLLYNARASILRTVRAHPKSDCYICSRSGSFARGDSWPLMARQD